MELEIIENYLYEINHIEVVLEEMRKKGTLYNDDALVQLTKNGLSMIWLKLYDLKVSIKKMQKEERP